MKHWRLATAEDRVHAGCTQALCDVALTYVLVCPSRTLREADGQIYGQVGIILCFLGTY